MRPEDSERATHGDILSAIACVAAAFPGKLPTATQEWWTAKLLKEEPDVDSLLWATDQLAERFEEPLMKHMLALMAERRRARRRDAKMALKEGPRPEVTDDRKDRLTWAATIFQAEVRRLIRAGAEPSELPRSGAETLYGQPGPLWRELMSCSTDELERRAEGAQRMMERWDQEGSVFAGKKRHAPEPVRALVPYGETAMELARRVEQSKNARGSSSADLTSSSRLSPTEDDDGLLF